MRPPRLTSIGLLLAATRLSAAQTPATPSVPVIVSGEIRARGEVDRPGGGMAPDAYTALRSRIGISAAPTEGLRLLFQVQDSRV